MSSIFKVGQQIELLDVESLGLDHLYNNGDVITIAQVEDDEAYSASMACVMVGDIDAEYARIL